MPVAERTDGPERVLQLADNGRRILGASDELEDVGREILQQGTRRGLAGQLKVERELEWGHGRQILQ
jgi:hypothetical protein